MNIITSGKNAAQNLTRSLFTAASGLQLLTSEAKSGDAEKVGASPVSEATVTLSDAARARLESDRAATAKLEAAVSASSESEGARASDFSIDEFFDVDIVEPDPTKVLQPVSADQQREMGRAAKMALVSSSVTRNNPTAGAGFQTAVADGSLKIQRADSVSGVNYKTTVTITAGPYGPVQRNETSFEPSAEIQAQIDAGRALAMWDSRLGDVFLSW